MSSDNKSRKNLNFYLFSHQGTVAEDIFRSVTELINQNEYTGKCRTLKDFSEEEIQALEKKYNANIKRPTK